MCGKVISGGEAREAGIWLGQPQSDDCGIEGICRIGSNEDSGHGRCGIERSERRGNTVIEADHGLARLIVELEVGMMLVMLGYEDSGGGVVEW